MNTYHDFYPGQPVKYLGNDPKFKGKSGIFVDEHKPMLAMRELAIRAGVGSQLPKQVLETHPVIVEIDGRRWNVLANELEAIGACNDPGNFDTCLWQPSPENTDT
jgi:hypothetical protein